MAEQQLFKVTIDNITIEVPAGTTILNAARKIGGESRPRQDIIKPHIQRALDRDGKILASEWVDGRLELQSGGRADQGLDWLLRAAWGAIDIFV